MTPDPTNRSRVLPIVLAAAICGWLALLLGAPRAATGVPLSAAIYGIGSLVCHQQPGRSFHAGDAQFPVCARCTGLYAGAAVGAVLALVLWPRRQWSPAAARATLTLSAVPTGATWLVELLGLVMVSNLGRAGAGLPLGAAVGAVAVAAAARRLR